GVVIVATVVGVALASRLMLRRAALARRFSASWLHRARRGATVAVIALGIGVALAGMAPGVGRDPLLGAASPLDWLPGYVPWPILILSALGLGVWGWAGVPRSAMPLILVGGMPALFYLPNPLVTGDHPWMVRRLVPAVIPLLVILATVGGRALWQLDLRGRLRSVGAVGSAAAVVLWALGLSLSVAADRDLLGPRHASGAIDGLMELSAGLPSNALVIFPAGPGGIN